MVPAHPDPVTRAAVLRNWLIRGLLLLALAVVPAAAWVMHDRMRPERVREALVAALEEKFDGVDVHVGDARLRVFGGITVSDLRLTREGEPTPFFAAPAAVIYHDKEQLQRGRIAIRKFEFDGPTVRLDRRADGTWNVAGVARPGGSGDDPVPTVVARNATVFLTDHRPDAAPPVVVSGVKLNLLNDPITVLRIDATATIAPAVAGEPGGPPPFAVAVSTAVRYDRTTKQATARVEAPDVAFSPDLAPAFAKLCPTLADHLSQLTARVGVRADVATHADRPPTYDVRLDVRDGKFEDPQLPWPVEQIAGTVRLHDGKVTVEKATAKLGKATAELSLESRAGVISQNPSPPPPPRSGEGEKDRVSSPLRFGEGSGEGLSLQTQPSPPDDPFLPVQDALERLSLTVKEVAVDDDLFARLPPKAKEIRDLFSPTGTIDLSVSFTRDAATWKREVEVRPNRLGVVYAKFRYPVEHLAGTFRKVTSPGSPEAFHVQMTGTAGGRRIEFRGSVVGDGPDPQVNLTIAGTDIPIDDRLMAAFQPKYAKPLAQLRANGRGDFVAELRQEPGVNRFDNTFKIAVYDTALNPEFFPYPMTGAKGTVVVKVASTDDRRPLRPGLPLTPLADTDTVEIRDFEATHGGGSIWISGDNVPVPGTRDRLFKLRIQGRDCPLDADMKAALGELKIESVWRTFDPRGKLTFGADLDLIDRQSPPVVVLSPPGRGEGGGGGRLGVQVSTPHPSPQGGRGLDPAFDPARDLKLTLNFRGPTVTPDFFPYRLDDLAGVVRYAGGKVDLARFSATHGESRWAMDAGEVRFADRGELWANLGRVTAAPLIPDAEFRAALPGKLRDAVTELRPRGGLELAMRHAVVKVPPEAPNAPPPPATVYWSGEVKLTGAGLDVGVPWENLQGVIGCTGVYAGTHLGSVVGNTWIESGTISNQPVSQAKLTFRSRPQQPDPAKPGAFLPPVVEVPDLIATLYRGAVGGEARITLADPVRYRLWLTAADVRLEELAANLKLGSGAELRGVAQAKLLIENAPDPRTGELVRTGAGQIDVPNGRMYNLPVLMPLLKLVKLQAPDQTAFEEAHAVFDLRGDRIKVTQLDLIGTALSLGGSGEMTTNGDEVKFEFYTVWSQALKRWLATPFGDVTSILSGNLFKIEMVKKNGEMQYKPHMLPVVTDPVRAVAERLKNRMGPK